MLKIYLLKEWFLLKDVTKNQMALNQYTVGVNWYALVYG